MKKQTQIQSHVNRVKLSGKLLFITILFVAACATNSQFDQILAEFHNSKSEYVMVAAHRASHNIYPENSLPAIQHAIDIGVDIIELDVKVSKDGVPFLMHDGTINRTTNGTGDGEEYTIEELKNLRLKNNDGTLSNETIPTFEEALKLARKNALIDIDIKTSQLQPIIDVVNKTNSVHQVFWFDNDYDALKEIRIMEPASIFMPRAYSYEMADSALKVFNPAVIHIDPSFYTEEVTTLIRENGARIWINALGKPDQLIRAGKTEKAMTELLKHSANVIQTDEPEKVIDYLTSQGLRE